MAKAADVALVTEARYVQPQPGNAYVENIFEEDRWVAEALHRRGLSSVRVSWADAEVDWSSFRCAVLRTTWDYLTLTGEPRLALASHDPAVAGEETVHHFEWSRSVRPGRVRAGQWTWKDDPRMLIADANVPRDNSVDPADRQRTFFVEQHDELMPPGRDAAEPEPDNTPEEAASTLRRFVTDAECGRGQANAIGLAAGVTFELGEHPEPDLDRIYVVTKIVHTSDCPHADGTRLHVVARELHHGAPQSIT